jgi:CRISPR system Cascade subunit CasD
MRSFLLFRLYGPMASWGEVAVGEVRSSALHPTRSALLGLLGAALGLRRGDDPAFTALGRTLRFAVLVESAGVPVTDYHTSQVMPLKRGRIVLTRADQLRERRHALATILSRRDYRCDAVYDVAAWHEGPDPAYDLHRLASSLERPVFTLYLGRKSCPLALPLQPRIVEAESVLAALANRDAGFEVKVPGVRLGLFWEGDPGIGSDQSQSRSVRRDDPVSSARRIFQTRWEEQMSFDRPAAPEDSDAAEPDSPVS